MTLSMNSKSLSSLLGGGDPPSDSPCEESSSLACSSNLAHSRSFLAVNMTLSMVMAVCCSSICLSMEATNSVIVLSSLIFSSFIFSTISLWMGVSVRWWKNVRSSRIQRMSDVVFSWDRKILWITFLSSGSNSL